MKNQIEGLQCPLCGSSYLGLRELHEDYDEKDIFLYDDVLLMNVAVGSLCGNQSRSGKKPARCSPEHPCKGRLVLFPEDAEKSSPKS